MTERARPELWRCPRCGRGFAHRNQSHSCATWDLGRHFEGREPVVREIYDAFVAMLEAIGPVTVVPEKTRIAFQARMSFAQLTTRKSRVTGHLVLARAVADPAIVRIESLSPRNHVHHFRIDRPDEVEALAGLAREAHAVGRQEHLATPSASADRP